MNIIILFVCRRALTAEGGEHGRMDENTEQGYSAGWVAGRVVEAVVTGEKELVLAPLLHRLAMVLRILVPSLYFWIMKGRAAKESS